MSLIHPARLGASLLVLLAPLSLHAATYYVSPTGSDTAAGTMDAAPFATVGRAQTAAVAGDTVLIHGGRYALPGTGTVGVAFSKSGTANLLINYFAVAGEIPIFDLTNLTPSGRVTGLDVHCNFIHIRGLEVMGVHQFAAGQDSWGVRIQGSNNILENLNVHNNDAPGVFITSGANNLILNCDSHNNWDFLEGGGSGDGFGCHSSGGGNVLSGCRSYDNSDDGYDFINAAGTCTVERSFSFRNGWQPGTTTAAGNGAGFKAGGYGSPPAVPATGAATHTVRQCVSFGNRAQGFYGNHHPGRINFFNNTAFRNPANYNMLADAGFPSDHMLRNNIAMATGTTISNLTGGTDTFNSWTLPVTVSAADFLSVVETEALAPRGADGSLPSVNFMRLVAGSDLIDKGTDVGLPFVGAVPDLGAFEFGATISTGTGGAAGTGGTGGAAGTGGAGGRAATGTGGVTGTGGGNVVAGTGGSTVAGTGGSGTGGVVGSSGTGGSGMSTSTGGSRIAGGLGAQSASGGCACSQTVGSGNLAGPSLFFVLMAAARLRKRKKTSSSQRVRPRKSAT